MAGTVSFGLQEGHHPVHEQVVEQGAQQDKDVEDLMAAEAGIVPARPLDGVEHAAHGVEHAAAHGPEEEKKPAEGSTWSSGTRAARASQPMKI